MKPADSSSITSLSGQRTLINGERAELKCLVEGDPAPFVTWINVTDGSVIQNRTVNTSYVIPSVSSHHKGHTDVLHRLDVGMTVKR